MGGGADELRHELYCGTPDLSVVKGVVSNAACLPPSEDPVLAVFDVRRAFFWAEEPREVYVELPD